MSTSATVKGFSVVKVLETMKSLPDPKTFRYKTVTLADGGDPARLMRFRKIESTDGRLAWAFDDLVYLEPTPGQ